MNNFTFLCSVLSVIAFTPGTTVCKTTTTTEAAIEMSIISTNPTTTRSTKMLTTPTLIYTNTIFKPRIHTTRPAQTVTSRQGKPLYIDDTTRRSNIASITTRSVSERNATVPAVDNQSATFNLREITYLITGISMIEVALTAIAIYIAKQRRMKFRNLGHKEIQRKTTNPYHSLSKDSGNGKYEVIELKDLSYDQSQEQTEHNECSYIEIIEHEYDYSYGDKPPVIAKIM
ncbi:uncharacterized protein LOC128187168 [Crassostrea angulata]|uniref:uncharacterized protein LOC128187168 n=1 Tax=Magallana angulata TaxID=2784310 RepID=UPI0022B0F193|nr:uncharacterized protein LOC128187168 [Crassostrea angulata]